MDRAALLTGARSRGGSAPVVNPLLPAESADPFTPRPVDPSAVTGTDAERLAAFESTIYNAKQTAERTLRAARFRFAVEAGTALREIRDQGLYLVTHGTFEDYIEQRWEMVRARAYQLIEAAPVMLILSEFLDTTPIESQARTVAPILRDHGRSAVREIVDRARQESGKVTAATIRQAAGQLGYTAAPAPAQQATTQDAEPSGEDAPVAALKQALALLRKVDRELSAGVLAAVAADPERGAQLVAEVAAVSGRISARAGRCR